MDNLSKTNNSYELSLPQALSTLLQDDELSDVALVSSIDATILPANRCILASRSHVFKRMLYGNFAEANQKQVTMEFSGSVIRMILEYCYTDQIKHLSDQVQNLLDSDESVSETYPLEICRDLCNLAMASDFLGLAHLGGIVFESLERLTNGVPRLACVVFDETLMCDDGVGEEHVSNGTGRKLFQHARRVIRADPVKAFWGQHHSLCESPSILLGIDNKDATPGIAMVGTTSLEKLLSDKLMKTTEIFMFCALITWLKHGRNENENYHECQSFATKMTRYICLDRIKPSHLQSVVSPSNLVSLEQLAQAYQSQALLAERRRVVHPACRVPVWDDGSCVDNTFADASNLSTTAKAPYPHILHNVILKWDDMMPGGVYKWDICVHAIHSAADTVWIGVINTAEQETWNYSGSEFLGNLKCGYFYGSAVGETVHCGRRVRGLPRFSQQVTISFTLDLRRSNSKNGTLVAEANGFKPVTLFENMLKNSTPLRRSPTPMDVCEPCTASSFVPAAVLLNKAEIEFLGFHSQEDILNCSSVFEESRA